jgi:GNAT superfamily N-acetyltransferase
MELEVKRLTIDDYESIIRLWADAGLPHKPKGRDSRAMMVEEMQLPNVAYYGLFEDDRMIGVGIASYDGRHGWINRVAIDPDRRGIGLAGRIIEVCENFLHSAGAVVFSALIEDENLPSMSCFSKAGFTAAKNIVYWSKRESTDL